MSVTAASSQPSAETAAVQTTRMVMTWVPPYAVLASQRQLNRLYNGSGPSNALSHLGLQFWTPTSTGGVVRVSAYGAITNGKIAQFVAWGDAHNVKTMLCIYNGVNGWDWNLARSAFSPPNRTRFVNLLVGEMQRRNLDGIDVDLEGVGDFESDKAAYLAFMTELTQRVHALGKVVTVDTFPYIWNAPNSSWWPELFPLVDGLTSMGYTDLGRNAPTWQSYAAQKAMAGPHARKLMIGMPSYQNVWQGDTAAAQAHWFLLNAAGDVGIGIWDAQNQASSWRTAALWGRIRAVRHEAVTAQTAAMSGR